MARGGNLEFWPALRKCPHYVFYNFFTTLIVLNTCLNYYLFFSYEEVTDLLLSIVRPETDLLLSIVRPETDLLLTENSVKTEVSCGKDRMWRRF